MTKTVLLPDPAERADGHWQSWWARIESDAEVLDWSAASEPAKHDRAALVAARIMAHAGLDLVAHGAACLIVARAPGDLGGQGVSMRQAASVHGPRASRDETIWSVGQAGTSHRAAPATCRRSAGRSEETWS